MKRFSCECGRALAIVLSICLIFGLVLTGCKKTAADGEETENSATGTRPSATSQLGPVSDEKEKPARYGDFGQAFARELVENYPNRYAGSDQEAACAEFIKQSLEAEGYQVRVQDFSFADSSGADLHSQNLIVEIAGTGFQKEKRTWLEALNGEEAAADLPADTNERQVLVLAHYDTPQVSTPLSDVDYQPDGIHCNGAGLGVLMTLARQYKTQLPGYKVKLIFTGASGNGLYAGAQAFLDSMGEEERQLTEAVYNIDSIYAGDKVYAHAGQNSAKTDNKKDYDLRRKLYEATDVYYNNLLLTNNGFELYTNQNIYQIDFEAIGNGLVYREWTTHTGDHTPFDRVGLPIVFFESYEYDFDSYDELVKESTDPIFAPVNGLIKGSGMDSSQFLDKYFYVESGAGADQTTQEGAAAGQGNNARLTRLETRINNLAFIVLESSRRGPEGAVLQD